MIHFIANKRRFERLFHRKTYGTTPAARRDNEDGFLIELIVQKGLWPNYPVIVKDTYTPLIANLSNFPNGREICVRRLNVIRNIELHQ